MITETIKLPKETKREKEEKLLIKSFNKESKNNNSKYYIKYSYIINYLHLFKKYLIFSLEIEQIYYNEIKNEFSFCEGIDEKTFNEIKIILENIPERFKIALK